MMPAAEQPHPRPPFAPPPPPRRSLRSRGRGVADGAGAGRADKAARARSSSSTTPASGRSQQARARQQREPGLRRLRWRRGSARRARGRKRPRAQAQLRVSEETLVPQFAALVGHPPLQPVGSHSHSRFSRPPRSCAMACRFCRPALERRRRLAPRTAGFPPLQSHYHECTAKSRMHSKAHSLLPVSAA